MSWAASPTGPGGARSTVTMRRPMPGHRSLLFLSFRKLQQPLFLAARFTWLRAIPAIRSKSTTLRPTHGAPVLPDPELLMVTLRPQAHLTATFTSSAVGLPARGQTFCQFITWLVTAGADRK